jgi:hypothetical protein
MRHTKYSDPREAFWAQTLSKSRWRAVNERGIDFSITLDDVMVLERRQKGKCKLTGLRYEYERGGKSRVNRMVATLDRIDSNQGYVPGNIQIACCFANIVKSDSDSQAWKSFWKKVTGQLSAVK